MVEYLNRKYYQPRKLQMRACHPRDLVEQVVDICRYQEREPAITRELLDAGVRQLLPRRDRVAGGRSMKRAVAKAGGGAAVGMDIGLLRDRRRVRPAPPTWRISAARVVVDRAVLADGDPPRQRLRRHRPAHRPAAARQRDAGRRADGAAPRHVARSIAATRARLLTAFSMLGPAAGPPATVAALAPELADGAALGRRPERRHRRQGLARPQLRPDAGQPRRRVERPVSPRPPPDLHGLPDHARPASSLRIRRCGTSSCWSAPTSP